MKQTIKYGQSPQHKTRNGKAIGERGIYFVKYIVDNKLIEAQKLIAE